jgi:hypothetical protein
VGIGTHTTCVKIPGVFPETGLREPAPASRAGRSAVRSGRTLTFVVLALCLVLVTPGGVPAAAAAGNVVPQGNWESLSASGSTVTAWGWALDPDTKTSAVSVHVYVDGRWGAAVTANGSRPDVGAAFPGAGNAHGWSWSASATPGEHSVCVYAIDAQDSARNTPLGCRTVAVQITPPVGNWEGLTAPYGTTLSAWGWAMDPDARTTPVSVHVYVDGAWGGAATADRDRPDVGAAFPGSGNAHGWSYTQSVARGSHSVCVYAIDVENPSRNTPLGCRTVGVGITLPIGNWEGVSVSGDTVALWGWALDPDSPQYSAWVQVQVDGVVLNNQPASESRPDVGAAFPEAGDSHGFSASVQVTPGERSVCVFVTDLDDSSKKSALGCRTVGVQVTPPVGSYDGASASAGRLTAWGWAFDPDHRTSVAAVHVYVDGRFAGEYLANGSRPDVGAAFPGVGDAHGWSYTAAASPGVRTVCAFAIDVEIPTRNTPLGCRQVTVPPAA